MNDAPRVAPLSPAAAREAAAGVGIPPEMADLEVFRVLLHRPELAAAVHHLLSTLLWRGCLDRRLRELAIMRIAWRTRSVYEWAQHWHVARLLEVPESDVLAVRDWQRAEVFDAVDRAVLAATDETIDDGVISSSTWEDCARHLDEAELVELVIAIGNWRLFSSVLRSLAVALDDGLDPWPPDGLEPTTGDR